jgi:hypothetical protein
MAPSRRSRTYLTLYFSLERPEDLDLLTWLYALPITRRGTVIKACLGAGLAAYLHAHDPDRRPLDRQAVGDLVATRARARRRRRQVGRRDDGDRWTSSPTPVPIDPSVAPERTDPAPEALTPAAGRRADDTEARLDRLLRSFLR